MPRYLPNEDGRSTFYLSADMKSESNTPSELALSRTMGEEKPVSPAEQEKDKVLDIPPDGGLVAWLQVFAGFLLVLNSR